MFIFKLKRLFNTPLKKEEMRPCAAHGETCNIMFNFAHSCFEELKKTKIEKFREMEEFIVCYKNQEDKVNYHTVKFSEIDMWIHSFGEMPPKTKDVLESCKKARNQVIALMICEGHYSLFHIK